MVYTNLKFGYNIFIYNRTDARQKGGVFSKVTVEKGDGISFF